MLNLDVSGNVVDKNRAYLKNSYILRMTENFKKSSPFWSSTLINKLFLKYLSEKKTTTTIENNFWVKKLEDNRELSAKNTPELVVWD